MDYFVHNFHKRVTSFLQTYLQFFHVMDNYQFLLILTQHCHVVMDVIIKMSSDKKSIQIHISKLITALFIQSFYIKNKMEYIGYRSI